MWIPCHSWALLYFFSQNPAQMWIRRRLHRSTIGSAHQATWEASGVLASFSILLRFYLLLYLLIPQLFTVGGCAPDAAWVRKHPTLRHFIHRTRPVHRNIGFADAHRSTSITRRYNFSKKSSSGGEQHSNKSNILCGCTAGRAFLIQRSSRRAVLVKGSRTCRGYSLGCNGKQEGYKITFFPTTLNSRGKEEEPRMHTRGDLTWRRRSVLQRSGGDSRAATHAVAVSCRPCIGQNQSDTEAPSPQRGACDLYTPQNVCACIRERRTTPTALRHRIVPQERRSRLPEGGGQPGYICCWQLHHSALLPAGAAEMQRHGLLWMDRWNQGLAAARRREATEWSATAAGTPGASGCSSSAIPTATFTVAAVARRLSRRVPPINSTLAEAAALPRSLGSIPERSRHVKAAPAEAAATVVTEASENCYRRQTTLRAAPLAAAIEKHGQGLAVDRAQAATTGSGSGAAASPGTSYGDVRTTDSRLLLSVWHRDGLYPNVSGKRKGVRCAGSLSVPRGEQNLRKAEAADTIYALSSMGDTTEFSPAAIAVWRISGPLAFLVLRLLMAKPLPSSRQGGERATNHQHGKHHQNKQGLRHGGQQQELWHARQRKQQEEREHPQHRLERHGEESQKHENQQGWEKTFHRQSRDNCKVLTNAGQHTQLPFVLRPLPEERVATFVRAWDCLHYFWEAADVAPSTVTGPASGGPRAAAAAPSAVPLDDIVVLRFSSPRSFTGEDVVEIHSHGSSAAVRAIRQFFGRVAELVEELQQKRQEEKGAEETQEYPFEGEEDNQEHAGGQMETCVSEGAAPTTLEEAYTQFLQQQQLLRSPLLLSGEATEVGSATEEHRPNRRFANDIVDSVHQDSKSTTQPRGPHTNEGSCSGNRPTTGYDVLPRCNTGHLGRDHQRSQSQHRQQLLKFVKAIWTDMQAERQDEQTPLDKRGVLLPGKFRLAKRGEFSLRAFLNGKLRDLHALRALAALVTAESTQQHRGALYQLRQPSQLVQEQIHQWQRRLQQALALIEGCVQIGDDESVADSVIASGWAPQVADGLIDEVLLQIDQQLVLLSREQEAATGLKVVICGPPNAGKSTLFNALLGRDAAIVSGRAGTTRDVLSAPLPLLHGKKALLYDTAGLHEQWRPEEQRRQQQTRHSEDQQQADAFLQQQVNMRQTGKEEHHEKLLPRVRPVKPQHNVWSTDPVEQEGMVRAVRAGDSADVLLLMMEAHTSPQVTIDSCRSFLRCFVAAAAAVRAAGRPATATASALATEQAEMSQTARSCRGGTDLREGDFEPNSSPFSTVVHHRSLRKETKSAANCFSQGSDVLLLPRVKRIYLLLNKAERLFTDGSSPASLVEHSPADAGTSQNSLAGHAAPGFAPEGASKSFVPSSVPAGGPADSVAIGGIFPSLGVAHDAAAGRFVGGRTIGSDASKADADSIPSGACTAKVRSASVPASTLAALSRIGAEELPFSLLARVVPVTRVPVAVERSSCPHGFSLHEQRLSGLVLPLSARCGWNLPLLLQLLEREVDSQQQQEGLPPLHRQGVRPEAPTTASLAAASAGVGQAAASAGRATGSMGDDCATLYSRRGLKCADDSGAVQTAEGTLSNAAALGHWDDDSATSTEAAGEGNICGEYLVGRREVLRLLRAVSDALRRCLKLPTTVIEEKAEELREALKSLQLLTGDEETGERHAVIKALLDTFCVGK